jgi:outer membrane protein OmpA-like peptidoglycan-associated protein
MDRKRSKVLLYPVLFIAVCCATGSASPIGKEWRVLPWIEARLEDHEREQVERIAKNRPAIDLEIYFRFGSSVLQAESMQQLDALGAALSSPELKDAVLMVAGHTDGLESDDFARVLSLRRATTVKEYIVKHFSVASDKLVVAGYGSGDLKDLKNPFADENRRVQIVNLVDSR